MGRFVSQETRRVRAAWWGEDEWVEVRKLSFLDRRWVAGQCTTYGPVREDGSRSVYVDTAAMDLALMERGVAAWNLLGERGKPVKLRKAALERLAEPDGEFIERGARV